MIKAILFDLDGTLVDSLEDIAIATNLGLEKLGYKTRKTEEFKYFVGDGIPKMLSRAAEQTDEKIIGVLKEHFFEHYSVHYADNTYAYDGMRELVLELKNRGYKVAVVTNKAQDMANVVVKKLYGEVFDLILGQRDGIPAKPDPTAAFMAMSELGVNSDECVFIGDSGMDVATAVNSGAIPVGELWGYRLEDELLANGARFIISKPSELLDLVEGFNK